MQTSKPNNKGPTRDQLTDLEWEKVSAVFAKIREIKQRSKEKSHVREN